MSPPVSRACRPRLLPAGVVVVVAVVVMAGGTAGAAPPISLIPPPVGTPAAAPDPVAHPVMGPPASSLPASSPPASSSPAPAQPPEALPAWLRLGVPAPAAEGRPTIAIMIDDMGLNRVQSDRAIHLPAPVTLSWMPYAPNVTEQAALGAAHGHETMLHMNMEALGRTDPGPDSMRTWLPAETNLAYLRHALDRLPNAVGLNQHEGSVASLSVPLMDTVMGELKARDLLFVDSLTIPHSVALRRAEAAGVPAVGRDIFLDNSPEPNAIRAQIAAVEAIARRNGHAIAIGHPRQTTMDALSAYLPTAAAHGFVLWPVSATVAAAKNLLVAQKPAAE